MRYLLFFSASDSVQLSQDEQDAALDSTRRWVQEMGARGVHLEGTG